MVKYGANYIFSPENLHPLNIDRQSTILIPDRAKVLDIGCATGFMGKYLIKKKGCYVVGVEMANGEARDARKQLNRVIEGDIEKIDTIRKITQKFDVVLASAIIEHLKDPWAALKQWKHFLKRDGFVVVTTPNIAHW